MDIEGFEAIKQAISDISDRKNIAVAPTPPPESHMRFVNILADKNLYPAAILNRLGNAGLMGEANGEDQPALRLIGQSHRADYSYGSAGVTGTLIMTFEDLNSK